MRRLTPRSPLAHLRLITVCTVALLWLTVGSSLVAAASVPPGAKEALAPVTKMIATLVAPREFDRLRALARTVSWFRAAGLDLASADESEIATFVRTFADPAAASDATAAG